MYVQACMCRCVCVSVRVCVCQRESPCVYVQVQVWVWVWEQVVSGWEGREGRAMLRAKGEKAESKGRSG